MNATRCVLSLLLVAGSCATADSRNATPAPAPLGHVAGPNPFDLGAFSISLAVKDLAASRAFYEQLGFRSRHGDGRRWLVMQNGDCNLGLFQGMFEGHILTFNPGWSHQAEPLPQFTDVRELQRRLEQAGLKLTTRADEQTQGPASFTLNDPDGNTILVDQHVP